MSQPKVELSINGNEVEPIGEPITNKHGSFKLYKCVYTHSLNYLVIDDEVHFEIVLKDNKIVEFIKVSED